MYTASCVKYIHEFTGADPNKNYFYPRHVKHNQTLQHLKWPPIDRELYFSYTENAKELLRKTIHNKTDAKLHTQSSNIPLL